LVKDKLGNKPWKDLLDLHGEVLLFPAKGYAMLIDEVTLRDLELFRTRDGRPGVFQTLDLTKTSGGSRALRSRFENPMSDPARIREVQAGVRFLLSEKIRFQVDVELIREVRGYLDSTWDVGSRARGLRFFLQSLVVSVRYRDLLIHARQGVFATQRLVSQLLPFLNHVMGQDPPPEVQRPVQDLLALINRLRFDHIRLSLRPWTIFRADRYLRDRRRADFQQLFELLSDLDALIAMAEAVEHLGLSLPEVVEGAEFILEGDGIFHPFLDNPVGNPVRVAGGETLVFLTGPNMAGKTTYLKAVAVSAFLAHVGMGVPAARFRITPLDAVFCSLSPEENLREGLSFFMAEVRRVRDAAEAVAGGMRALVVFDEVFRGTNVKDAMDASRLVILGFSRSRTSGFIFSSHLVELAEDLKKEPAVRFAYFDGEIRDGRAWYEFQLKEGVSNQRFGLQLLEQEGVPQILGTLGA
jgi:DNA mismatch repair protein MutS